MERRSFLKGLLIGAPVAGQALVQLASPEEAAALEIGKETTLAQLSPLDNSSLEMGDFVFVRRGDDYIAIGVLLDIKYSRPPLDVTSWSDRHDQYIRGRGESIGRFVVLNG